MGIRYSREKTVLITGGTSGLGLELVKLFLNKGFNVVATGRQQINLPGNEEYFKLFRMDLSDLEQVASYTKKICEDYDFDIVINNAGVLSPPDFTLTTNGLEYTFQINFLSHLLINEIIIQQHNESRPLVIAAVTSPVYRLADTDLSINMNSTGYKPVKAYSDSKFYMLLMCKHLSEKYSKTDVRCFGFNPGTFRSGIYRMQKIWFRQLYRIAAPFMRSPGNVASVLTDILINDKVQNGMIYDLKKRVRQISETDKQKNETFWKSCYDLIVPFINQVI